VSLPPAVELYKITASVLGVKQGSNTRYSGASTWFRVMFTTAAGAPLIGRKPGMTRGASLIDTVAIPQRREIPTSNRIPAAPASVARLTHQLQAATGVLSMKKERIIPPSKRELTDASKMLKRGHSSAGRVMAEQRQAKRQGARRSK
jgi:hypothetical protein